MTRGMLVTVLWRLDGETAPKTATTFTDVDANAYYADAVAWAAESGVVNGIGGNKFDPEGNVTREQIAAILFRYAAFKGVDTGRARRSHGLPGCGEDQRLCARRPLLGRRRGARQGHEGRLHDLP